MVSKLTLRVRKKLEGALNDYSHALETHIADSAPVVEHNLEKSVRTRDNGHLDKIVGIDTGKLLQIQFNRHKIDYASLVIKGHGDSPWVPMTRPYGNAEFSAGYWWAKFPAKSGNPFVSDALRNMPNFSTYYNLPF